MQIAAVIKAVSLLVRIRQWWRTYSKAKADAQDARVRRCGGGGV